MIVVAYNHNNLPVSIVNTKSVELAIAYWHGAGINVHHHRSGDELGDPNSNGTGVIPILKTAEIDPSMFSTKIGASKVLTVRSI